MPTEISKTNTKEESVSITEHLKPGDLIVFKNHYYLVYGDVSKGYEYTYIDHIAMVSEVTPKGVSLLHSLSSDRGHYHPKNLFGICTTNLKALERQVQEEDDYPPKMYDVSFLVYRFNQANIARRAHKVLNQQSRFRIPYDEKRLEEKISREDEGWDDTKFMEHGKAQYFHSGRYRSLKYAARYPMPWTRTRKDGLGRGLTCSMAIILSFQTAELKEKKLISDMTTNPDGWVSDKYGVINSEHVYSEEYTAYLKELRKNSTEIEPNAQVSADLWKGTMPIEEFVHQSLPLEAKSTGAAGIHAYISSNIEHWSFIGEIDAPVLNPTPEEKQAEQLRRRHSFELSVLLIDKAAALNPSTVSRRHSLTPLESKHITNLGMPVSLEKTGAISFFSSKKTWFQRLIKSNQNQEFELKSIDDFARTPPVIP